MQQQIRTKEIKILNAENGDYDLLLRGQRQNPQQIITKRIRILNAHNGDFELMVEEDHTLEDALIENTELNEYYNDRVTSVFGDYRFQKTNFKIIRLPNVTSTVGNYNFHGGDVSLLEELYLPSIVTSGWNSYLNNPNLRIADIGKTFGGGKITGCPNLEILIIRDTSMKAVGNTWLTGTKLASDGTGGYVYVPQSLVAQYEASQAWADYANVIEFRAIEGSIYE